MDRTSSKERWRDDEVQVAAGMPVCSEPNAVAPSSSGCVAPPQPQLPAFKDDRIQVYEVSNYDKILIPLSPKQNMAQVFMLDSERLSSLLRDALSSSDQVSSLLISATNGSILAYAYRDETPKIKDIRTQSTTMTTAYAMASEDTLVYEAQNSGAIAVLTTIADHILLGVMGPKQKKIAQLQNGHPQDDEHPVANGTLGQEEQSDEHETEQDPETQRMRDDLETVSQELADILREELASLRWPDDI